jgi:aryl-alcohol dehydrogenase-like predicted oxidoreductase
MDYRLLGRTGVSVSPLCLGTMMFGPWGNADRADSVRVIHRALDGGINFVDTADVYSEGVSEEIVGEALQGRRDDVVLATKFFVPMGEDPNQRGGSRRWIMREVENSLRRLRTDHIDLYQVHRPSPDTDVEETLGASARPRRLNEVKNVYVREDVLLEELAARLSPAGAGCEPDGAPAAAARRVSELRASRTMVIHDGSGWFLEPA